MYLCLCTLAQTQNTQNTKHTVSLSHTNETSSPGQTLFPKTGGLFVVRCSGGHGVGRTGCHLLWTHSHWGNQPAELCPRDHPWRLWGTWVFGVRGWRVGYTWSTGLLHLVVGTVYTSILPISSSQYHQIATGRNLVHGSDSVESAMREVSIWFTSGMCEMGGMHNPCSSHGCFCTHNHTAVYTMPHIHHAPHQNTHR